MATSSSEPKVNSLIRNTSFKLIGRHVIKAGHHFIQPAMCAIQVYITFDLIHDTNRILKWFQITQMLNFTKGLHRYTGMSYK